MTVIGFVYGLGLGVLLVLFVATVAAAVLSSAISRDEEGQG